VLLLLVLPVPVLLVDVAELCEELGKVDEGELEAGGLLLLVLDCDAVGSVAVEPLAVWLLLDVDLFVAFTSLCGMLDAAVEPDVVLAVVAFDSPVALPVWAEPEPLLQFAEIIFTLATCSVFWPVLVFCPVDEVSLLLDAEEPVICTMWPTWSRSELVSPASEYVLPVL
jgi:hypothetical protein